MKRFVFIIAFALLSFFLVPSFVNAQESKVPDWVFDNDWSFLSSNTEFVIHLDKSVISSRTPFTITISNKSTLQSRTWEGNYTFSDGTIVLKYGSEQTVLKIDNLDKCLRAQNGLRFSKRARNSTKGIASNSSSQSSSTAESTEKTNEYAWLVGTWTVNTPEFGRISLIISGNGQTGRINFDGDKGSYEVKGSEIRCHMDYDPKDLVTVFEIHSGHRLYFGEGYYFKKVK